MAVILFYAMIIIAGGLAAAGIIVLPRLALQWAIGGLVPAWLTAMLALPLSLVALKLLNRAQPGLLFLTSYIFAATLVYYFGQVWQASNGLGRAVLVTVTAAMLGLLMASVRRSGPFWPLALIHRINAFLA